MTEEEKIEEATPAAPQAPEANIMKTVVHSDDEPVVSAKELLAVGAHYGHQARRWNPAMAPYIFAKKSNAHIIDLNKTAAMMQTAYLKLKEISEKGGKILFVGTKPIAKEVIASEAVRANSFYVNNRWLGGTLTNFKTINQRIKLLNNLEKEAETTDFEALGKKEAIAKKKQIERLNNLLGGIKGMLKLPSAIVIVDTNYEHNAVHEAKLLHIPSFGFVDTNCDPSCVDYPIPMNVEGPEAVALAVGLMADAVIAGRSDNEAGVLERAYANGSADTATMSEILPSQFSADELRVVRAKIREDILEAKRKNKKHRKASKKKFARRPAGNKPAEGAATEGSKPAETTGAAAQPEANRTSTNGASKPGYRPARRRPEGEAAAKEETK